MYFSSYVRARQQSHVSDRLISWISFKQSLNILMKNKCHCVRPNCSLLFRAEQVVHLEMRHGTNTSHLWLQVFFGFYHLIYPSRNL